MAETDMKALSELDSYNNKLDANSLLPMTVRPSGSNITRKVYYPALKTQIAGYDLVGILTAGSTSLTLSSAGDIYNEQNSYIVGDRVTYTGSDEVTRNYICVEPCSAANWATNSIYFVEYEPLNGNSIVDIYTTVFGVVPTDVTINGTSITLTFDSQSADIGVKVRVR